MAHFRPMKSLNTANHDNVPHSTPSDPQTDTNNNSQSYFFKEKIDIYYNSNVKRMNIDISVR